MFSRKDKHVTFIKMARVDRFCEIPNECFGISETTHVRQHKQSAKWDGLNFSVFLKVQIVIINENLWHRRSDNGNVC